MAEKAGKSGCSAINVNGQRVPLTVEGLKQAHDQRATVARKMLGDVRTAVKHAAAEVDG